MIYYFYKTTNLITSEIYYGSGTFEKYLGSGIRLDRAKLKYGEENFIREDLKYFETRDEAFKFEDRFLKLYKISSLENTYNLKDAAQGGDTISNHPNKIDIVKRIQESNTGKKRSIEIRNGMSISQRNKKPVTQKTKDLQSQAHLKRMEDPEERAKCNSFLNKTAKEREEQLKVWSNAQKGSKNGRFKYDKPVNRLDPETREILETYDNACEAAHSNDKFYHKYILATCKGKAKKHAKFGWEWMDNNN